LLCAANCGSYNTANCSNFSSGNCCIGWGGLGCQDAQVQACVCALDSFCCNNSWDGLCANEAINDCGATCP